MGSGWGKDREEVPLRKSKEVGVRELQRLEKCVGGIETWV